MIAKSKYSHFLYITSMSRLLSSMSRSDMKRCFINRCDFRNVAKGVVAEVKHPRGTNENVKTRSKWT